MASAGVILALDLGVKAGAAIGTAGFRPEAILVTLKEPGDRREIAFANLVSFLEKYFRKRKPSLVFKEAMLPLAAFAKLGNAEATVRLQAGLHAIVEAMCGRYGIQCEQAADSTIRRHFLGVGRLGDRQRTKAAVIDRCHQLALLPRTCRDDNMADALAAFDFASATYCRRPLPIALFPARRAAA